MLDKARTLEEFTTGVDAFTAGDFALAAERFARVLDVAPDDATAAYFADQAASFAALIPTTPWDGRIRMDVK